MVKRVDEEGRTEKSGAAKPGVQSPPIHPAPGVVVKVWEFQGCRGLIYKVPVRVSSPFSRNLNDCIILKNVPIQNKQKVISYYRRRCFNNRGLLRPFYFLKAEVSGIGVRG